MAGLPDKNSDYARVEYWNERYASEDSFEWCKNYSAFRHLIQNEVNPTDRILMLGCGNSSLSQDMYDDGYHFITNVDYSSVVIENMRLKSPNMNWLVKDIKDLDFPPATFDVVIEKATLDALLVDERDPWQLSDDACRMTERILDKVNYVLVPDNGRFLSITFAQPHFRRPVYNRRRYDWSVRTETFGDTFHFFFYIMTRGRKHLLGTDCDENPYDATSSNSSEQQKPITFLQQSDNIDYLNNIEF